MTYDQLHRQVEIFFYDRSRSAGETSDALLTLRDEIDVMIETLAKQDDLDI